MKGGCKKTAVRGGGLETTSISDILFSFIWSRKFYFYHRNSGNSQGIIMKVICATMTVIKLLSAISMMITHI